LISNDIIKNRDSLRSLFNFDSYKVQLQNSIKGKDLYNYFELTDSEKIGIEKTIRLNVSTTPYYLLLSDPFDPACPIRKMIVPDERETILSSEESPDPLHEERLSPVKGLTRMYSDRALLFTNQTCSVYCRHCMRGRKVSFNQERIDKTDLDVCFDYLENNPEITDVVVSGGDPLNLSNEKIEYILSNLEKIKSVKICRIGTRNPVTLPMRIDNDLCYILEKYNTDNLSIFCNTQFNIDKECTIQAKNSILKLLKSGISVGNQTVLLKDINDSGEKMLSLHKKLLEMRIRAYYMYDPEIIPGSRGFRTPLYKGIEIIEYMRGKISGMGIPNFVNDLPGGGGKITLSPQWYLGYHKKTRNHVFRSAIHKTIHLSYEVDDSPYIDKYKEISDEEFLELSSSSYSVHNWKKPINLTIEN
jgi:lysine 2,3-aminomutase